MCQCPCGYGFEKVCSENDAVALVQSHINRFHSDLLPFGITYDEAMTFLKIENTNEPEIPKGPLHYAKTEHSILKKITIMA